MTNNLQSRPNGETLECIVSALGHNGPLARAFVETFFQDFVEPFKNRLAKLTFTDLITRKNPYLYRASGISSIEQLVERALGDFASSSTETFFGTALEHFITSLPGIMKSSAAGVDIERRRREGQIEYVDFFAIKSGPGGYNSSSFKTQREHLARTRAILAQQKNLVVNAYVGFAYGQKSDRKPGPGFIVLSSKNLWAKLTDDESFYIKLLDAYGCVAKFYESDVVATHKRLLEEARQTFTKGATKKEIDWLKVIKTTSG